MDYDAWVNTRIELVNASLRGYLRTKYPEVIYEAMSYTVFPGGKRLRPLLLLAFNDFFGGNEAVALPFACTLELIHNYSLIHDDLPAMDDDNFRRGKPTNHRRFGEGIAILAGDGLLNLAYEIMAKQCAKTGSAESLRAMAEIAVSAGCAGMVGGQVVDLIYEGKKINEQTLLYMIKNKTGKLIKAAICAGAALAGAGELEVARLDGFAYKLGLAFQIKDDILDLTGDEKLIGKPIGSDIKNNKQTYPSVFGIQRAKDDYNILSRECLEFTEAMGEGNALVVDMVKHILAREF